MLEIGFVALVYKCSGDNSILSNGAFGPSGSDLVAYNETILTNQLSFI